MTTRKPPGRALAAASAAVATLVLLSPNQAQCDDEVTNVTLEMPSPAAVRNGTHIEFTYDYQTDRPAGIRVYTTPLSDGNLPPIYGTGGLNTHEMGTGTGNGFFTIPEGAITVDSFRLLVRTHDDSETLCEVFTPVFYHFNPNVDITSITVDPVSPAALAFGERVNMTYDYASDVPEGIRIFPRPVTNGSLTPNYGASGSPIYVGAGSATGSFTISGPSARSGQRVNSVLVDHIRFLVRNSDQSVPLATFDVPVSYTFDTATPVVERSWGQIKASFR